MGHGFDDSKPQIGRCYLQQLEKRQKPSEAKAKGLQEKEESKEKNEKRKIENIFEIMKRENINKAVELGKLLERLEMCRDLLQGGCNACVESASGETYYIKDEKVIRALLNGIMWRIDDINKEFEEL